jgi:CubicO group peptidase (beta-lactamase class C family)
MLTRRWTKWAGCGLAVVAFGVLCAQAADEEEPVPGSVEELRAQLESILSETETPGVGYALISRDGTVQAAGVGLADVASGRPATGDTLFRIGSISKMFVSMSVLALVEEGRLNLHDRLADLAPEIWFANPWERSDPVRIVNLLEHTAGFDDISLAEYAHQVPDDAALTDGLDFRPDCRRARWRPGTRMSYCNMGPPIAARVVEKLTGQRYESFVNSRFFDPLEMRTATFFEPGSGTEAATLYFSDGVTPQPYWHILVRPSGAINASAEEMAHLVRMLLDRGQYEGRSVLSEESVSRMERPETTLAARAGLASGYGLNDYAYRVRSFVFHGHDGGVNGGLASLGYLPEHGLGYVFMTNSGSIDAFRRIRSVLVGYLTRDLPAPEPPPPVAVPPGVARRWAGWYGPGSPRQETLRFLERLLNMQRVSFERDTLLVAPLLGNSTRYLHVGDRLFRHEKWPSANLALVDDPDSGPLLQWGTDTLEREPIALVWAQTAFAGVTAALLASILVVAPVWLGQRLLRRRFRGERRLGVLGWPFAASASLAAAGGIFAGAGENVIPRLGAFSPWSVGLCAVTLIFAALSVVAVFTAFRAQRQRLARLTVPYARAVAMAAFITAGYLAWWGWIGARTWV